MNSEDARRTVLAMIAAREPKKTVCPSEVAKVLAIEAAPEAAFGDWRAAMPLVHAAIDELLADGKVRLSWKGRPLKSRHGPYRIARGREIRTE